MERITNELPKVEYGKGAYLYDSSGKQYIDGSGGPAVFCLGHAHPEVNAAVKEQIDRIAHGYRFFFSSDPLEQLTELLQEETGLQHAVFVSSGSEATESALKIALQYHWVRGESSRVRFVSRRRSYHGNTLGALAASDFAIRRAPFEGALGETHFVSAANVYRPPPGVAVEQLADHLADELEQMILEKGPETIAAFIFEPVVGAAGGVVPAPPGYARKIRRVCDKYGVLLIADEVMCGAGRCGTWRALEFDGITPDIMMVAKGLGGGFVPLGATLYSAEIGQSIFADGGAPNTGHTFTGHTLACAAALRVQEIVRRDSLIEHVRLNGELLIEQLRERLASIDAVGDVRGRGYFIGIELVRDRESKQPFDASLQLFNRVLRQSMEAGLICYPVGGNVDGSAGDVAILAPPYNASNNELGEIIDKLETGLRNALRDIGAI